VVTRGACFSFPWMQFMRMRAEVYCAVFSRGAMVPAEHHKARGRRCGMPAWSLWKMENFSR
jgi:hypothetical protein